MNYVKFQDVVDDGIEPDNHSSKIDLQELQLIIDLTQLEGFNIFQSIYAIHFKGFSRIQDAAIYLQHDETHRYVQQNNNQCGVCNKSQQFHVMIDENSEKLVAKTNRIIDIIQENQQCCVCYLIYLDKDLVHLNSEKHLICLNCFYNYLRQSIDDRKINNIRCPHCDIPIRDIDVLEHSQELYTKYIKCHQNLEIAMNPNKAWCPTINCNNVIEFKQQSTISTCAYCKVEVCKLCKQRSHPLQTCEENLQQVLNEWQENRDTQQCPRCKIIVEKINGCNHMTCQFCQHEWCWICGSDYTSIHYAIFNPFGCPALMPGWIRQKDWSYVKLIIWRFICFILLIIFTPMFVLVIAPLFCIAKLKQTSFYRDKNCWIQACLLILALLIGVALIPIAVVVFAVALVPSIIGIIVFYYDERKRLEFRHQTALSRHFQQNA
ncbi:unnamed protein product [Paramecium pentaurelia]|uniref:RING-type domain-containing protein n=1 Tax=Paramecium pentaurelia TaxID=43138 RepID=A0A8S1X1Q4_9CILI|nr:unnamed protein product [Paramecium pentaurelia]